MKHKPVKVWEFYSIENGKLKRKKQICSRCGEGFLAEHRGKDRIRYRCGKCGLTIFSKPT